jgi:hypothetical protein
MNKRDKRAMNRIRKRHAELMLLGGGGDATESKDEASSGEPKKHKLTRDEDGFSFCKIKI